MFKHQPLDLTKQQIRLLRLHPTPENEDAQTSPIQCEIMTVDAKDAVYTTLSYVWGPPSPNQTIQINGKPFVVRQILYDFLKVFRDDPANGLPDQPYLWIDQLCIDQDNELERNHQVQMMSDIYRGCQYVIIWLHGPWKGIARVFKKTNLRCAVANLFSHKYFTRLWIIQEILLSPRVEVLCDNVWLSWDQMKKSYFTIFESDNWFWDGDGIGDPKSTVWLTHPKTSSLSKSTEMYLHSYVERFMNLGCQLAHDKIYGLIGLVKPEHRPIVDYNKTIEEVSIDYLSSTLPLTFSKRRMNESEIEPIRNDRHGSRYFLAVCGSLGINLTRGLRRFWQDILAIEIEPAENESVDLNSKTISPYPIQEIGFTLADTNVHNTGQWWFQYKGQRYVYFHSDSDPQPSEWRERLV